MNLLDQQRARIQDDLRGLVAGEVRCDDVLRQLFASDAGIHEVRPLGVVRPHSTSDVVACVRYAAEKRIPLHARGAGTGVAGESLGPGLVLDFSVGLHRIVRIDADRVRVQPGVVRERLVSQLRRRGQVFGPDPTTSAVTTIGGMVAIDASGSRWLKYGSTRRHVRSLQVVLADGHVLEAGREPLTDGRSASAIPRKRDLIDRLAAVLGEHAELIRRHRPRCPQDHVGYHLADVLQDDYLDLAGLLIGSEGTLAITTEATLGIEPIPSHRGMAILLFDSLEKASHAVADVLPHGPAMCDLMDRRHLSLAREVEPRLERLVPNETEALLLVELDGEDSLEMRERLHRMVDELWQQKRLVFGARQAFEEEEIDLCRRLMDRSQPALHRVTGPSRPASIVEDMAVAPASLPDFLVRMQNVLKRSQVTASFYCHAGQGQIHLHPFLDLADPDDLRRMRRLADELYGEVFAVGGSVCGEHACGLSRTPFVRVQAGPLFEVFDKIKKIFDPDNIFNPGKIVGDDPDLLTRHVRPSIRKITKGAEPVAESASPDSAPATPDAGAEATAEPALRSLVELQVDWEPSRLADAVEACNRCGECRTQEPQRRMCPIFRFRPAEEASPRAKVNLIRGILTGSLDLESAACDEFKTVADMCVHCHSCRLECPACVDVPRLMCEAKGAYVAAKGLPLVERVATRPDLLGALAGLIAPAANWAIGHRQMRWLLEKTLGIAQGQKLPRVASRNFLRRAARRRLTRPSRHRGPKVLYFVDTYADRFDPALAEAAVAVFEHNGVPVYVHPEQKPAGMPSIACGSLEHARKLAGHNVAFLAEAVRQGYHVVATEPAAALCLRREYPQLLDNDDDARLVANHSSEACGFLWNLYTRGQLQLDFEPVNLTLGYHAPCLLRALEAGLPGRNLLGLIPGIRLHHLETGCCGMAGTFGLLHRNHRNSLRVGRKLIARLRDPELQVGVTECSACKMQMEQGTAKPTLHPIQLLALSYGLAPSGTSPLRLDGAHARGQVS